MGKKTKTSLKEAYGSMKGMGFMEETVHRAVMESSYELALETALYESLKLINNEKG